MIQWAINIVCVVAAIVCYCLAPEGYNYTFCASLAALYIAQNISWLVLSKRESKLGFELFFMISFFFVNFAYPVIYAPANAHWNFFQMAFNRHIINQATAMAYLAYSCYMVGVTGFRSQLTGERLQVKGERLQVTAETFRIFCGIAILGFVLFVATGGYTALKDVYSEGKDLREVGIYSYFNNIFSIGALLMAATVFRIERQRRAVYLVLLAAFIIILLSTGSRQFSISLVIVLLMGYSWYVHPLKGWQTLCLIIAGAAALFVIMQTRSSSGDWQGIHTGRYVSVFDVFEDLSINAINLYVLVDWGNCHDLTWLHGMLLDLCSPIPKLGSWLVDHMDEAPELLHGGDLPSYLLLGRHAGWGTGTNMVGEAYRSFGIVGMCVVMAGIGALIREAYNRSGENIYWCVFYLLMTGHAVIYPRAPLLYDPRTIIWTGLLLFVAQYITNYLHAQAVQGQGKEAEA